MTTWMVENDRKERRFGYVSSATGQAAGGQTTHPREKTSQAGGEKGHSPGHATPEPCSSPRNSIIVG